MTTDTNGAPGREVTVELKDPGEGVAVLLDDATSRILELEARGYHPAAQRPALGVRPDREACARGKSSAAYR